MTGGQFENHQPAGWPAQAEPAGRHSAESGPDADDDAPTASLPPTPGASAERRPGRWRRWRRSRPFWGGLLVVLGGAWIFLTERPPLPMVLHLGLQGLAGLAIPIVMVLCGLLLWFNPAQRLFYSVLAVLLSLGSLITSNLGGFVLGMLLGIIGGSLAFGWTIPRT